MKYEVVGKINVINHEHLYIIGKGWDQYWFHEDNWLEDDSDSSLESIYKKIGSGKKVKITVEEIE